MELVDVNYLAEPYSTAGLSMVSEGYLGLLTGSNDEVSTAALKRVQDSGVPAVLFQYGEEVLISKNIFYLGEKR